MSFRNDLNKSYLISESNKTSCLCAIYYSLAICNPLQLAQSIFSCFSTFRLVRLEYPRKMKKIYSHCLSTTLPTFSWLYVFARYSRKQENSFEPARWRYREEAPPLKAFDRSADFLKNASEFNSPTTARNYGTLRERQAESRQKRVEEYIYS